MDSLKKYVVVWLSGVLAGLVMVERWRRAGARAAPATAGADPFETATVSTASKAPPEPPTLAAAIVAGAKADARRARQVLDRMVPSGRMTVPIVATETTVHPA